MSGPKRLHSDPRRPFLPFDGSIVEPATPTMQGSSFLSQRSHTPATPSVFVKVADERSESPPVNPNDVPLNNSSFLSEHSHAPPTPSVFHSTENENPPQFQADARHQFNDSSFFRDPSRVLPTPWLLSTEINNPPPFQTEARYQFEESSIRSELSHAPPTPSFIQSTRYETRHPAPADAHHQFNVSSFLSQSSHVPPAPSIFESIECDSSHPAPADAHQQFNDSSFLSAQPHTPPTPSILQANEANKPPSRSVTTHHRLNESSFLSERSHTPSTPSIFQSTENNNLPPVTLDANDAATADILLELAETSQRLQRSRAPTPNHPSNETALAHSAEETPRLKLETPVASAQSDHHDLEEEEENQDTASHDSKSTETASRRTLRVRKPSLKQRISQTHEQRQTSGSGKANPSKKRTAAPENGEEPASKKIKKVTFLPSPASKKPSAGTKATKTDTKKAARTTQTPDASSDGTASKSKILKLTIPKQVGSNTAAIDTAVQNTTTGQKREADEESIEESIELARPPKRAKKNVVQMAPPKKAPGKAAKGTLTKTAPKTTASKPTKTTAAKSQTKTPKAPAEKAAASRKRKAEDTEDQKGPAKKQATAKKLKVIGEAPKLRLKVFVFGEGGNGELGLGAKGNVIDVKRPRLNPFLLPANVGVVQVASGGMHAAALTHDNRILTWGVNDQGTLGRDTLAGDQTRDIDANDGDSDAGSDTGLNPLEAEPAEIDLANVPEGTVWTKVALGDSVTFAVTDTGLVYGCGTFRSNDGVLGFSSDKNIETKFVQVAGLKNIVDVTCGSNHALALDNKGAVFAWGSGQQSQLGRRIVERTRLNGLRPTPVAFPRARIHAIGNGNYHSFALDNNGQVWAWGLNSFGETGIDEQVGESEAVIVRPQKVPSLAGKDIVSISGGAHHSLALTREGSVLVFGRCDASQSGLDVSTLPSDAVLKDDKGQIRILRTPQVVPDVPAGAAIGVGPDSNIVVARSGRAYSWGFSVNYQTGQGTSEDIEEPTLIDNTATREEKLVWAGAGGQYGMLASHAEVSD